MNTKKVGVIEVVAGMGLVLAGRKKEGLLMFSDGFYRLEKITERSILNLSPV